MPFFATAPSPAVRVLVATYDIPIANCMQACDHAGMQPKLPGIVATRRREAANDKEPLQVRIPSPIKRRFKTRAAMRGIEPNELFVEVWDHYERTVIDVSEKA